MTESGFVKAQSDNLPKTDIFTMVEYIASLRDSEIKGMKAERSERESYGDSAVGYVQLERIGSICVVKARITLEHGVLKKCYNVKVTYDEAEETIVSAQCEDCAAHLGGCKHVIVFVAWLHRRSEEPPKSSIECYWKKSKIPSISRKFIKAKDICNVPYLVPKNMKNNSFLSKVKNHCDTNNHLTKYFKEH